MNLNKIIMKKLLLSLIVTLVSVTFVFAQNYNIDAVDGTTITDCTITLYDSGGNGGVYGTNETYTVTVCSGSTDAIEITFVDFYTESSYDEVTIYDGTGTGGSVLGTFSGSTIPGNVTSSATCITIEFTSDGSVQYDGFQLTTACVSPPPSPCDAIIPITGCGAGNAITFVSATSGSWASNPCYSSPGGEQIYSFTPTVTSTYDLEITSDGTYVDYCYQAGSCGSGGWTCIDDVITSGTYGGLSLTAGTTYYFYLDDENTTSSTHSFYVTCPPCTPANATITQTCAGDNSYYDLEVDITALVDASSVDIIIGGTTEETSVGVGTYTYFGITSGTVVEIVDDSDPTCIYAETISMCDLCSLASAPSDLCADAPLIDLTQPFEGSTDCSYTVGPTYPTESCGISLDNDSWITFIAGATDVEMDYTVGDCDPIGDGIQLTVFEGANCSSLSEVAGSCVNPTGENTTGTWNFTGLTIGETYYIRIDGYAGDLCDYYFEPGEGVVITPPNNACDDAVLLTCGDTDIASNILADAVDAPAGCSGGGTPGDGVWYTFIGDGSEVTISTDNPGTNFDTEINVFEGPCTSVTCIGGDNDGGVGMTSSFTFTTTNGTEYFIYVDGDGTAIGQFEVSLTCNSTPPCDADAGAWD